MKRRSKGAARRAAFWAAAAAALVPTLGAMLAAGTVPARAASAAAQQQLVDRATLAAEDVLNDGGQGGQIRNLLRRARAVMICPRVFKAGFIFGGEGGGCVLLARGGQGSWSAPAFYDMGGGSFGLQAGLQDAELMMLILTPNGLRAVMDSQFRLGASASLALITLGGGVEGATTTNLNADILAFAKTRGLFAGVSIQGSVMSSDSEGDEAYYGQPVGPVDILLAMRANNPGADPLRAVLMRDGAPPAPAAPQPQAGYGQPGPAYASTQSSYGQPGYAESPPSPGYGYSPAPVQAQSLPPPH